MPRTKQQIETLEAQVEALGERLTTLEQHVEGEPAAETPVLAPETPVVSRTSTPIATPVVSRTDTPIGNFRRTHVFDPFGNRIELMESPTP